MLPNNYTSDYSCENPEYELNEELSAPNTASEEQSTHNEEGWSLQEDPFFDEPPPQFLAS